MASHESIAISHEPSAMAGVVLLEVLAHQLGHLEHVDRRLAAEHGLQRVVGLDHALVLLVLEAVLLDVRPELLGDFGARHRLRADHFSELVARLNRLHERGVRLPLRCCFLCHLVSLWWTPTRRPDVGALYYAHSCTSVLLFSEG